MSATVDYMVFKHHKKANGTYNVKICVTLNRKRAYITTEHNIAEKQITKDFKQIKDRFITDQLNIDVAKMRKEISSLGAQVYNFEVKALASHLSNTITPSKKAEYIDIVLFARQKIEQLQKEGRKGTAKDYLGALNHLVDFIKKDFLDIKDINTHFLKRYEVHLRGLNNIGSRGIEKNLILLRALFNFAREEYNNEDTGIILIPHYPFASYKIPKADIPRKRALDIKDIISISNYEYDKPKSTRKLESPWGILARDMYMLSFYLLGINSADIYNLTVINKGRIEYNRTKTKDRRADKAFISVKIPKPALLLIDKYRDDTGIRVFNFYKRFSTSEGFNAAINKGLKIIGASIGVDKLQYYSARHSWATIARNKCNISKDDIAMALNHTDPDRRITDYYIETDWSIIDRANEKVIKYFNKNKSSNKDSK